MVKENVPAPFNQAFRDDASRLDLRADDVAKMTFNLAADLGDAGNVCEHDARDDEHDA